MAFIFLILLVTATILWWSNRQDEATRWAVLFLLCGSSGSLGVTIQFAIMPSLKKYEIGHPILHDLLYQIQIYSSFLNQITFSYAILMYAIVYSGLLGQRLKRMFAYLLLIPVIVMFFITPRIDNRIQIDYMQILTWVVPYLLTACVLLIVAYGKEKQPVKKRNRLYTALIIVPTVLGILFFNYVAKALQLGIPLYRYLALFVGLSFVLFLLFAFKHGALGVRLRFERQRLDTAMRAMTTGASFINHAIKNEIGKIKILSQRVWRMTEGEKSSKVHRDAGNIKDAAEHVLEISSRLHNQLKDFQLDESVYPAEWIVKDSLKMVATLLEKKQIQIRTRIRDPVQLFCDHVMVQEGLDNVLINAIEAMNERGTITIFVYRIRKRLIMEVQDEGSGIPDEQLKHLLEPFFTTKQKNGNMGLGLSFCYNVMQKHEGSIEIESVPGKGTVVRMCFPWKRVAEPNGEAFYINTTLPK